MTLFDDLKNKISDQDLTIVFPEGNDKRVLGAAIRLANDGLLKPIVLGKQDEIAATAKELGTDLPAAITAMDPENCDQKLFDEMVEQFVARRHGKNTREDAEKMLRDVTYFGTMLVYMEKADGLVSGAAHATADTVRPALQIIKTKPGSSRISASFLMMRNNEKEKYIFADCAINIDPNAQELAEIALQSADTAKMFGMDPRVAMLSFSTKGSAKSDQVTKVVEATKKAHELAPDLDLDGELQFDAAFVPSVGERKAPGSKVAGKANVFVFPELQSGNIGYKIAQRLGKFEAIGPILQGMAKPVSDLSRGASEEDVYKVAILTAAQALM